MSIMGLEGVDVVAASTEGVVEGDEEDVGGMDAPDDIEALPLT